MLPKQLILGLMNKKFDVRYELSYIMNVTTAAGKAQCRYQDKEQKTLEIQCCALILCFIEENIIAVFRVVTVSDIIFTFLFNSIHINQIIHSNNTCLGATDQDQGK